MYSFENLREIKMKYTFKLNNFAFIQDGDSIYQVSVINAIIKNRYTVIVRKFINGEKTLFSGLALNQNPSWAGINFNDQETREQVIRDMHEMVSTFGMNLIPYKLRNERRIDKF
jgi:hypothetical protein